MGQTLPLFQSLDRTGDHSIDSLQRQATLVASRNCCEADCGCLLV